MNGRKWSASLREKIALWKSKLPLNGDWLFVTVTPVRGDIKHDDIADKFSSIDQVMEHLTSDKLSESGLMLIYERAKEFAGSVSARADHVRGKASTLLSTSSLVSAVLFGALGFMMSDVSVNPAWIIAIELFLGVEMMCHFIRSLFIAADVMTREVSVEASPSEILSFDSVESYLKNAISQSVAYGNMTSEYIRKKVNRLIIGQHAFRYGLIFFAILLALQTGSRILNNRGSQDLSTLESVKGNYMVNAIDSSVCPRNLDTLHLLRRDSAISIHLKSGLAKPVHSK